MLYLLKPVKLNEHAYITLHHIWANVSKNVVILDVDQVFPYAPFKFNPYSLHYKVKCLMFI